MCGQCGAAYRTSTSLAHHARLHDGLTLCPVCGVAQSRVCNLRRHLVKRHRLSREQAARLIPQRADRQPRAAPPLGGPTSAATPLQQPESAARYGVL